MNYDLVWFFGWTLVSGCCCEGACLGMVARCAWRISIHLGASDLVPFASSDTVGAIPCHGALPSPESECTHAWGHMICPRPTTTKDPIGSLRLVLSGNLVLGPIGFWVLFRTPPLCPPFLSGTFCCCLLACFLLLACTLLYY